MSNSEKALEIFSGNFNCAQSVLSAYSDKLGLNDKVAKKISCGFGTGCARQSLLCGAVTGAYMVIGLKFGKAEDDQEELKQLTYNNVNQFSDKFKFKFGSLSCYELLGCDLATDGGLMFYDENDLFNRECKNYVKISCEILDEMGF